MFYQNLMTEKNMLKFKSIILPMLKEERGYYTQNLFDSIQNEFDFTLDLLKIRQNVFAIYGDRGVEQYENRISDLNLPQEALDKIYLRFIRNSCHMMMMENPRQLAKEIELIVASQLN